MLEHEREVRDEANLAVGKGAPLTQKELVKRTERQRLLLLQLAQQVLRGDEGCLCGPQKLHAMHYGFYREKPCSLG